MEWIILIKFHTARYTKSKESNSYKKASNSDKKKIMLPPFLQHTFSLPKK